MLNLKVGDLVIFKNQKQMVLEVWHLKTLNELYDSDLNCLTNDDYTIIEVRRPSYFNVFKRGTKSRK